MILVRVLGGLGNQMFQYAFYKALSMENDSIFLDISDYKIHSHHNGFEMKKIFNVSYEEASEIMINKLSYNKKSILYRGLNKFFQVQLMKSSEYKEFKEVSNVECKKYYANVYFDGFWQSERYFNHISNIIRKEFTFKQSLDEKNLKLLDYLKNKNSVSIHIRRGDYINNKLLGEVCDLQYYNKAINLIKSNIKKPIFVFFSDDMKWVKQNFILDGEYIFVDWNREEDSYKDMQLMANCKHNVIANSTFSWWGAWLNKSENKIIVAPSRWFANSIKSSQDIIPKEWIKI